MSADDIDSQCNYFTKLFESFPHVAEVIFFSLNYKSYKSCLGVNQEWREILTSESYKNKARSVFREGIARDKLKLCFKRRYHGSDEAKILVSSGIVDANCRVAIQTEYDNLRSSTPLLCAASAGNRNMAKLLLERGADPNLADSIWPRQTPLHQAACLGHKELMALLIKSGAEVNVYDDFGATPLHKATYKGHKELIAALIKSGAKVNVSDNQGMKPLHKAAYKGHKDLTAVLIKSGAEVNVSDNKGKTPLHIAASKGHMEATRTLIEMGAEVNACDDDGRTPLCEAAHFSHKDVMHILIENGADVKKTYEHFACTESCKPEWALDEMCDTCLIIDFYR